MLSDYLSKLLFEHNRVIIPELGAFLLRGEENKSLYFNEFLRFNDGLLVSYVAEQEQIELIDAAKAIKSFSDDTLYKLHNERSVDIEGLCTLYLDSDDKIQLKNIHLKLSDEHNTIIQPEKENKPSQKDQLTVNENNSQTGSINNMDKKEETNNTSKVKNSKISDNDLIVSSNDSVISYAESVMSSRVNKDENQNRFISVITSRNVIIIASGLFIVLLLVYLLFAHQENNSKKPANISFGKDTLAEKLKIIKKNNIVSKNSSGIRHDTINKSDSEMTSMTSKPPVENNVSTNVLSHKEISKDETIKKSIVNPSQKQRNATKYYIVAGCFSQVMNAEKMLANLKSEGYGSEIFAVINNLHYVCYSSFYTKDSASLELGKLKSNGKTEAWILEYGQK